MFLTALCAITLARSDLHTAIGTFPANWSRSRHPEVNPIIMSAFFELRCLTRIFLLPFFVRAYRQHRRLKITAPLMATQKTPAPLGPEPEHAAIASKIDPGT